MLKIETQIFTEYKLQHFNFIIASLFKPRTKITVKMVLSKVRKIFHFYFRIFAVKYLLWNFVLTQLF